LNPETFDDSWQLPYLPSLPMSAQIYWELCCLLQLVIGEADKRQIGRPTTVLHNGSAGILYLLCSVTLFSVFSVFTALKTGCLVL